MAPSNKKSVIHVLHVDDDPSILEISKQILMDMGNFEIDHASCVDGAFKKMEKQTYDALVSDYEMPLKNGLEFLRELREQRNEIPFILFTGKGREDVAVQALNLGADSYINKSGSPETVYCELAHAINKTVERKKPGQLLAASESKYRMLVEKSLQGILITLAEPFRLVFANEAMGKIVGYSSQELMALSPEGIMGLVYHEDRAVFFKRLENRFRGELAESCLEFRAVRKDGSIIWLNALANRVEYDGQPAVQGMFLDVNERRKTEDALKQERDKLESVTATIGAGLVIVSKDYHVLWANNFIRRYKGDVKGKLCYAALNTLDAPCPDCGVAKIFAGKTTMDAHEYCSTTIDGKLYWVEIVATPITDNDGNVISAVEIVVDITEKKLLQQKLQANEAKFRAINESAIDAIFLFDEEDRITYWNPAAERIFGYTEKEVVGEKVNETLVPPRFRRDHLKLTEEFCRVNNKKIAGEIQEFPALRKDGTEFSMELSMAPLQLEGKQYIVAIARDITDRKKAEEALNGVMDQLVLVNEKLGVVGGLTRHDVRNKLCAVTGNAYLLKKKHADQADIVDGLGKMEQACTDIETIFDFARMYEQLGVEELKYVDAEKTINEAAALFSGLNLRVVNDCHGLSLLADSFLRQLFYNFIDNTRKYGGKATAIRVYCEKAESGELRLIYEDDGVGISAENKLKLFSEGFSTGGSTGFGLFLIRKMMDVYGWQIKETGEPGKGAQFTITIPKKNQENEENFQLLSPERENTHLIGDPLSC